MSATWEIREGDALARLRELPGESVQACITSPPYYGLRDYGTGEWEGGDQACSHVIGKARGDTERETPGGRGGSFRGGDLLARDVCRCGARRIDRQIGLERTPDEYVTALVNVFREVRRVLRPDGTLWLNLGDSYAASRSYQVSQTKHQSHDYGASNAVAPPPGCKPKDLLGIPWLTAFALRADGWYLRSEIVWSKPNPMPESVTDRPTSAHEKVFLLAKSARYFYDAEAIREPHLTADDGRNRPDFEASRERNRGGRTDGYTASTGAFSWPDGGRNRRNVWTIATQPYPDAHFATFPPKLVEPCVLAGSAERACGVCGAPWQRVVEVEYVKSPKHGAGSVVGRHYETGANGWDGAGLPRLNKQVTTTGWQPSCEHDDPTGHSLTLDPFAGSGTTGLVALRHNRSFLGIELSSTYAEMARERIRRDAPLLNTMAEACEPA